MANETQAPVPQAQPNKTVDLRVDHVQKIFKMSASDAARWHPILKKHCMAKDINTVLRYAGLFGQLGIESANLKATSENLNYSASGLMKTFPKAFPDENTANQYAKNPQKIANRAYANPYNTSLGNGNEASGEGWKYRGRGLIQVTGKWNYGQLQKSGMVNALDNPDLLMADDGAVASAVWYWSSKGLNNFADKKDWNTVTKRINAAKLHYDQRVALTEFAIQVLLDGNTAQPVDVEAANSNEMQNSPPQGAPTDSISQPVSKRDPKYPWNWVFQSRSNHLIEVDDTPGAERLCIMHRSGSFVEFYPMGDVVKKTIGDDYQFVDANQIICGSANGTTKYAGDYYLKANGSITLNCDGVQDMIAPKIHMMTPLVTFDNSMVGDDAHFNDLECKNIADLKARDSIHADLADRIGGIGGSMIQNMTDCTQFDGGGAPTFTKKTSFTQPTKLATAATSAALPPAGENAGCVMTVAGTGPNASHVLMFSDGQAWKPVG